MRCVLLPQPLGQSVVEVGGALLTLQVVRPFVRVAPADVLAALVSLCALPSFL